MTPDMTVKECADEARVSPGTVMDWIEAGHLVAFLPPGKKLGDKRPGPKGIRIPAENWKRFRAGNAFTGSGEKPEPKPTPLPRPHFAATGTDGIKRRGRKATA